MPGPKEVLKKMIGALPSLDFGTQKGAKEIAHLAKRYIWWKMVDQAAENPKQIVAQIMNMGDWNDVYQLMD